MNKNISFEMNEEEKKHSAIKTIISMLMARKWLDETDKFDREKYFNELIKNSGETLDTTFLMCKNKNVAIKFYNSKLNSLKNDREIDTFLTNYSTHHKILIVNEVAPKPKKQILDNSNIEVFTLIELIKDISQHILVDKHVLLTKEEAEQFIKEYDVVPANLSKIYIDDPMSRFLFAKPGDIIKIIRYSEISGYSSYYRLVVTGSILG